MKDTLQRYGSDFQIKCIAALLSEKSFLERIYEILDPKIFESDASQWIVEETKKYFIEYKNLPTPTVFKCKVDDFVKNLGGADKQGELLKNSIIMQLRSVYQKTTESDIKFVKDEFLNFCINQSMKNAILESADLVRVGEYNKIRTIVENALKAGMEKNLGHDYVEDVEKRLSGLDRACVKTNIPTIDDLLNGGLGKGELGFIIGPSGAGKCVGPNTEIEIQYKDNYKTIIEKILIKDFFKRMGVEDKENAMLELPFYISVKTPFGFKKIRTAFRTEKQRTVTTYFKNNKTLKTSENHLLKANGQWKKVKDITRDDVIDTEDGTTFIERKDIGDEEILYDISVESVHCYYSNGILSHNSWILSKLGMEAIKQGKNVMHFTLELSETITGLRYDSCFTGIGFQEIKEHSEKIRTHVKEIESKLNITYFPMYSVSPLSLRLYVERYEMLTNKHIDLIIVDYADLLKPETKDKNSNSYSEGGSIYGELRGIAGELQKPIWTVSQGNRGSYDQDIVEAQHIADSFKKVMIGDFVMSLARKKEDKVHSLARIHIVKNRFGPDGMTFPAKFDTDCGKLDLFDPGSREGMEIQEKMGGDNENNSVKSLIKNRWNRNKKGSENE